jgi:predicted nucleic acid-binding protein
VKPVISAKRFSLDTNVLVYAVDSSAGERYKRAQEVIAAMMTQDCVLTLQSLSEFYFTVTRKGKLPPSQAKLQVECWQALFPVVVAESTTLNRAIAVVELHQLSFWDAMLWSTAQGAGVTRLLSEDFQDGQELGGIRIVNPFQGINKNYLL